MHREGGVETMINRDIKIDLGRVDYDNLKTDEDIRREARRILPQVLAQIGEAMGEETWNLLQKSLKGSGLIRALRPSKRRSLSEKQAKSTSTRQAQSTRIDLRRILFVNCARKSRSIRRQPDST